MPYQKYPIVGFKTGKETDLAPWLVMPDGFPALTNGRVNKGVLEKRNGSSLLASTGASLPIMGIFETRYKGTPHILVPDTKRLYSYDITTDVLTDLSATDHFTGQDYDYFKFADYINKCFFVNGVNGIHSADYSTGSAVIADVNTSTDDDGNPIGGAVNITTCRGLFVFKDRLHFVQPTIGGIFYGDRIYYTDVLKKYVTNSTQWYIYGRSDVPVACHPLDMESVLALGHKGSWRIQYTGDTSTPFTCKTVDGNYPCLTPHAVVEFHSPTSGRLIATLSNTHIAATDGFQWRKIDWPIRDLPQQMAMRYLYYAQGTKAGDRESVYLTYPATGDTYPTKLLEYNINENNWAEHTLTLHCIQGISGEVNPADYSLRAGMIGRVGQGYTYAGDRSGNLFRLDYGSDDNGANITFTAKSAALNPYHTEGHKAYLGWIDLYADNDSNASFTMNLYKDDGSTAYKTIPVSCNGAGDRYWQRIHVGGEVGNFHHIEITNTDTNNRPRIHAICPWFKRGGLMAISSTVADWPDQTWRLHAESGVTYIQRKESGSWVNYQSWGA